MLIKAERNSFTLCGDLGEIAERAQLDFIPAAKDDGKVRRCLGLSRERGPGGPPVGRVARGPKHSQGKRCLLQLPVPTFGVLLADGPQAMQPNDGLTLRSGQDGDDYRRDSIERDEKRLAELGRRTVEMFVISHIFCEKLEIAYREAEALKRQDQLIAEEFEMARLEESKAQAKALADKEKKAKKKVCGGPGGGSWAGHAWMKDA